MPVEIAVLYHDGHIDRGIRDLFQIDIFTFVPIKPPDHIPLQHQGSDGGIDEDVEQTKKRDHPPKGKVAKP